MPVNRLADDDWFPDEAGFLKLSGMTTELPQ
jgi:hypothetical protein